MPSLFSPRMAIAFIARGAPPAIVTELPTGASTVTMPATTFVPPHTTCANANATALSAAAAEVGRDET